MGREYSKEELLQLKDILGTATQVAKAIDRPVRTVSRWLSNLEEGKDFGNILCMSDIHFPAPKEGYIEFALEKGIEKKCKTLVLGGDMVDHNYLQKYDKDLDYYNPSGEFELAKEMLEEFYEQIECFDNVFWVLGNHDLRMNAKAKRDGTPPWHLKTFKEVYDVPSWITLDDKEVKIYNTLFKHKGRTSKYPHIGLRDKEWCNAVVFDAHSRAGIDAVHTNGGFAWGAVCGCGADQDHPAMRYSTDNANKHIYSCLTIENEGKQPYLHFMEDNFR